jgi:hypothetical protein
VHSVHVGSIERLGSSGARTRSCGRGPLSDPLRPLPEDHPTKRAYGADREPRRVPDGPQNGRAIVFRSPVRERRPRSSASRNGRSRYAARTTRPLPPRYRRVKRNNEGAARTDTVRGRARKNEVRTHHDVPHCDRVIRRSRQLHASTAPSRGRRPSPDESPLLPHERLRELPRRRTDVRDRDLSRVRCHPAASPLTRPLAAARSPAEKVDARPPHRQHRPMACPEACPKSEVAR